MRLSTVFELLLIFLFLAFAASRTIHKKKDTKLTAKETPNQNRYCQCTSLMCNCCRDFSLPVVSLKGPGCATVAYLNEDAMRLTMTFGDKVLRNITLAGKRPNPVCMPLPGGVSKFCGRVYGITRDGDHFKACLALELRSLEDLEAALRVSCFRFGPEGVKLEPGRPVPAAPAQEEDDDDDDDYGFSDEDDDEDDDFGLSDEEEEEEDNDVDGGDADYTGFSALSDQFLEGFFGSPAKVTSKVTTKGTTKAPQVVKPTGKPARKPAPTPKPLPQVTTQEPAKAVSSTAMDATDPTSEDPTTMRNEESDEGLDKEEDRDEEDEDNESGIEIVKKEEDNNNIMGEVAEREGEARRYGLLGQASGRGENITPEETERLFPGLTALIRPPSYTAYSFPPVRSARTHRRMRLPPLPA